MMRTRLFKSSLYTTLSVGVGMMLALPVLAKDEAAYEATKAKAKVAYEQQLDKCKSLSGNANDICKAEAKLAYTKEEATAESQYKGTSEAAYEAKEKIAKAQYDLDKERCDDLSGNEKDVCEKKAKEAMVVMKEDAKVKHKGESPKEAKEEKQDAAYKVEMEKCEALAGDAKKACEKSVKAQFNK